jgi:hypothetical protein
MRARCCTWVLYPERNSLGAAVALPCFSASAMIGFPLPVGEVGPGGQGVGVVGAEDPLADGQQGGILVAGRVAWVVAVCRAWPAADRCSPTLAATQANRRGAFANAAYVLLAGKGLPPRMTRSEPGNRWRPALCDRY